MKRPWVWLRDLPLAWKGLLLAVAAMFLPLEHRAVLNLGDGRTMVVDEPTSFPIWLLMFFGVWAGGTLAVRGLRGSRCHTSASMAIYPLLLYVTTVRAGGFGEGLVYLSGLPVALFGLPFRVGLDFDWDPCQSSEINKEALGVPAWRAAAAFAYTVLMSIAVGWRFRDSFYMRLFVALLAAGMVWSLIRMVREIRHKRVL